MQGDAQGSPAGTRSFVPPPCTFRDGSTALGLAGPGQGAEQTLVLLVGLGLCQGWVLTAPREAASILTHCIPGSSAE